MGFLDWMGGRNNSRKAAEPENEHIPVRHETRKWNAIDIASSSEWRSDGVGIYEWRCHVGKSVEGYHGGLEVSRQGGEGLWAWSNARPTLQDADSAAHRMAERWTLEMGPEMERIANIQQGYSEARNQRDETAKESGIRIIGEWRSNSSTSHEMTHCVGWSIEGYHGGLKVAASGGDGVLQWSDARPTIEAAVKACRGMSDAWERGHEHKLSRGRGVSWDR